MQVFDPRMGESGRGVLFPLPSEVIDREQDAGILRVVARTWYSPGLDFTAGLCTVSIDWSHPNMVS